MKTEEAVYFLKTLNGIIQKDESWSEDAKNAAKEAIYKAITAMQNDPPSVRRGKWEKARNRKALSYADVYAECSVCHGEPVFAGRKYRFCPRCGAEMQKEEDDA